MLSFSLCEIRSPRYYQRRGKDEGPGVKHKALGERTERREAARLVGEKLTRSCSQAASRCLFQAQLRRQLERIRHSCFLEQRIPSPPRAKLQVRKAWSCIALISLPGVPSPGEKNDATHETKVRGPEDGGLCADPQALVWACPGSYSHQVSFGSNSGLMTCACVCN